MSFGLFEEMSAFDEGARIASRKVTAVATKRVADRFAAFLSNATSHADRLSRLTLVEDDVRQVVAEVVDEYGEGLEPDAAARLEDAVVEHLRGDGVTDINGELADAPSAVGTKSAGGHASDCSCGFCANKGKGFGNSDNEDEDSDKDEESDSTTAKTADAPKDGGGAVETVDLSKADETGLGGPSPKIDHSTWDPNDFPDVDAEMAGSPHPTVESDIYDVPDWESDFLDQTDAVTEQQDVTQGEGVTPGSPKAAEQWTGTDGLANPVAKVAGGQFSVVPMQPEHAEHLQVCDPTATGQEAFAVVDEQGKAHAAFDPKAPEGSAEQQGVGWGNTQPKPEYQNAIDHTAPFLASQDPDLNPLRAILEDEEAAINAYEAQQ